MSYASLILVAFTFWRYNYIHPSSVFVFLQVLMVNVGLSYYKYSDELLVIEICTFSVALAGLIVSGLKKNRLVKNESIKPKIKKLYFWFCIFSLVTIFLLKNVLVLFGEVVGSILTGSLDSAIAVQAEMRREFSFGSANGVVSQLKNVVLVYLAILIVVYDEKVYRKITVAFITLSLLLVSGQRWPLFEAILVGVVFIINGRVLKFSKRKILFSIGGLYILLFWMSYLQPRFAMTDSLIDNIKANQKALVHRFLVSSAVTSTYAFDYIEENGFGNGRYIYKDLSTYLPGYQEGFATEIYRSTHGGKVGSASFSTLTLFYADFGYYAIFVSFIYAFVFDVFGLILIYKRSVGLQLLQSFLVLAVGTTALGSVAGIFFHGIVGGIFVYILIHTRII